MGQPAQAASRETSEGDRRQLGQEQQRRKQHGVPVRAQVEHPPLAPRAHARIARQRFGERRRAGVERRGECHRNAPQHQEPPQRPTQRRQRQPHPAQQQQAAHGVGREDVAAVDQRAVQHPQQEQAPHALAPVHERGRGTAAHRKRKAVAEEEGQQRIGLGLEQRRHADESSMRRPGVGRDRHAGKRAVRAHRIAHGIDDQHAGQRQHAQAVDQRFARHGVQRLGLHHAARHLSSRVRAAPSGAAAHRPARAWWQRRPGGPGTRAGLPSGRGPRSPPDAARR
jgi:hypothetical protein